MAQMSRLPLGYLKDSRDSRDLRLGSLLGAEPVPPSADRLARGFDLQLRQNAQSCVGFSISEALYASWKLQGIASPVLPSPRFIWFNSRVTHHAEKLDSGTYIREAFRQIAKLGYCPERECESLDGADLFYCAERPGRTAYRLAIDQRLQSFQYYRLDPTSRYEWQRALSHGDPIVFGMPVSRDYLALRQHELYRGDNSSILGGHAQCALAYDERGVRGPGTWGAEWGNQGWWSIGWEFLTRYATDVWAVRVPSYYH